MVSASNNIPMAGGRAPIAFGLFRQVTEAIQRDAASSSGKPRAHAFSSGADNVFEADERCEPALGDAHFPLGRCANVTLLGMRSAMSSNADHTRLVSRNDRDGRSEPAPRKPHPLSTWTAETTTPGKTNPSSTEHTRSASTNDCMVNRVYTPDVFAQLMQIRRPTAPYPAPLPEVQDLVDIPLAAPVPRPVGPSGDDVVPYDASEAVDSDYFASGSESSVFDPPSEEDDEGEEEESSEDDSTYCPSSSSESTDSEDDTEDPFATPPPDSSEEEEEEDMDPIPPQYNVWDGREIYFQVNDANNCAPDNGQEEEEEDMNPIPDEYNVLDGREIYFSGESSHNDNEFSMPSSDHGDSHMAESSYLGSHAWVDTALERNMEEMDRGNEEPDHGAGPDDRNEETFGVGRLEEPPELDIGPPRWRIPRRWNLGPKRVGLESSD